MRLLNGKASTTAGCEPGNMPRTRTVLFTISIDTEIDKSPAWTVSADRTFRSVTEGIPERLTPLFDEHGARPTYLLSGEVIDDKASVRALNATRGCELGTHLHGEFVAPHGRAEDMANERTSDMQCAYPEELEFLKLRNLSDLFTARFGRRPLSFRAGRFGAGGNTVRCLEELGYLVDTSVTPTLRWDYPEGLADFSHAADQPYHPSREDIALPGRSRLLEVPVSITTPAPGIALRRLRAVQGSALFQMAVNALFPSMWLRPSHTSSERMIRAIEKLLRINEGRETVVLNMMMHSMEVVPNASPVTRSESDVDALIRRMDDVLRYGRRKDFRFVCLHEVHSSILSDRG